MNGTTEETKSQEIGIIQGINSFWQMELSNPESIWFVDKFIENEIKKLNPRARWLILEIAKKIKWNILEKGVPYYSQQELADHFGCKRESIARAMSSLEKLIGILFIRIPIKIINPSYNKYSSGRWIPLPSILLRYVTFEGKVCNFQAKVCNFQAKVCNFQLSIPNNINNLQAPYVILCSSYVTTYSLYKELKFFNKERNFVPQTPKKETLSMKPILRVSETKPKRYSLLIIEEKPKRLTLLSEEKSVSCFDYGFNPYYFNNLKHIDFEKQLSIFLEEVVNFNIKPYKEETLALIKHWNGIDNKKFNSHSTKKTNTITFKEITIAISYRIGIQNVSLQNIIAACNNYSEMSKYHRKLKYARKLKLINLLTDDFWFNACIKSNNEMFGEIFGNKTEFEPTLEKIQKSFAKYFFHNSLKLAKYELENNYSKFVEFTNGIVKDHKEFWFSGLKIQSFINEYFAFVKKWTENWSNSPSTKQILNFKGEFIRSMINEPMYGEDFVLTRKEYESMEAKKALLDQKN